LPAAFAGVAWPLAGAGSSMAADAFAGWL